MPAVPTESSALVPYEPGESIDIREAAKMLRGRRGLGVNLEVARRWCRYGAPVGGRQQLILPSVRVAGTIRLMPQWVEWWERERARLSMRTAETPLLARPARSRRSAHRRADEGLRLAGM